MKCISRHVFYVIIQCVFPFFELLLEILWTLQSAKYKHGCFLAFPWRKNAEVLQKFNSILLDSDTWLEIIASPTSMLSPARQGTLLGFVFWMGCSCFGDYCRRIASPLYSYPDRWFLVVKTPHDQSCELRRQICNEVQKFADAEIGNSICKIRDA